MWYKEALENMILHKLLDKGSLRPPVNETLNPEFDKEWNSEVV